MHDPAHVAAQLRELARLLEASGAERFKVAAYERAAHVVSQITGPLDPWLEGDRLTALPGIGRSIAGVIRELATTGTTTRLERLRAELPRGFRELVRVPRLGPKRVRMLHAQLGIQDLDDLEAAARAGRLAALPGLSRAAEAEILASLPALRARRERFLLVAALALAERLEPWLRGLPEVADVRVGGAVRRRDETVEVLDLLVATEAPEVVLDAVAAHPELAVRERSPAGLEATTHDELRVRVHLTPPAGLGRALVEVTGPASHVDALRQRAPLPDLAEEEAVYRAVGVAWVPPELRDLPALPSAPVDDLVDLGDVVGFVHCHTTWSDGNASILEMAQAVQARGGRYLTITDHSPAASYAGGLDPDRLRRQWEEIDRVQEQVDIVLLKGTESDILADGSLDWPVDLLEQLDVVIASVHQRYRLDRRATTERLVAAMRLPFFKIWGHGLGRLLLRRDPIDVDLDAVLDAAAEGPAAIEINGDPRRLDLPPEGVRKARERGLRFVLGVDAHSVSGLDYLPLAVAMARKGGVRRHEVLNALPAEAFRAAVRPAGA